MNPSIVPREAASKHSNACMTCPPGKTSIRNRPPVISSTTLANCTAAPWMASAWVQAVDIRHLIFGWAMTFGASTIAAAATAASAPLPVTMNRRRSVMMRASLDHEPLAIACDPPWLRGGSGERRELAGSTGAAALGRDVLPGADDDTSKVADYSTTIA